MVMDDLMDQSVMAPWRELGAELLHWMWGWLQPVWRLVQEGGVYLMGWPFMCHAGLVLSGAWLAAYLHLSVALVCILGFLYLFQIESRQRHRLNRSIGYEERKKARKSRMAEGETVRWMNEVTEKLWPIFLEDFASQMLLVPMNSFLDRFCKPWSVKKLLLQNLSLGKNPPSVTMVRVLDEPTEGDDLAMEASLEWNAANDMAAVLAIQVRRRLGLGMWTNMHLCNLEMEGKVKVGVKFRDGWPLIERIRICFAQAPLLDMKCHPVYNSGVDVSELPGIASYLDRLVADALAQSLVEPNQMEINMVKLMKDVMRPQGPAQSPKGDWFAFRANPPAAYLTLQILEATNLRVGDLNGYSDPYVRVTLNGTQHRETKVIWRTLNPKWNESFGFSIPSWEEPNSIMLKVRDKDHIFDDQLGYQIVELSRYRDCKEHDVWLPLLQVDTGKIHLKITVYERSMDSPSSEDVPNTNSMTLEKGTFSAEFDGHSHSQPLASSPNNRRQRRKNHATSESPTAKVSRQRSGFFSSRSIRKAASGIEMIKPDAASASSLPTDAARAAVDDETTTTALDVGFGAPGAVRICQAGNAQQEEERGVEPGEPEEGRVQTAVEAVEAVQQLESEGVTNVEEDGGAARKLRSAGLAIHGKFHRAKEIAVSPRHDLQTRRRLRQHSANDEVSDSEKQHHLGSKAKGVFAKAAGQLNHQISKTIKRRRKKEPKDNSGVLSSEEVTTSGELTPLATETEVQTTTDFSQEQQGLPSSTKPPNRPPPGLPTSTNNPTYDGDTTELNGISDDV